jgi:amino acid transporter
MSIDSSPGRQTRNAAAMPNKLQGHIGFFNLVFTVIAYNAPMVVFLGFIPVTILLGTGIGTPTMYLFCGVIALLFAIGLVAMGLRLPKPGGYYTFVSAGLGKPPGLGTGFAAMACYYAANLSTYALGGVAAHTLVVAVGGPNILWWVYSLVLLVGTSVLGYLNIAFSARALTIFLALELLLLLVYNIAVISKGGAGGFGLDSFEPANVFSGSLAIGFILGIGLYGGFEATVIFRDEVKRPARTIPRATYAVVATLAVTYAGTAYVFINAYGADTVMAVVANNVVGASTDSVREYVGDTAFFAVDLLLITSALANLIASHNIIARYIFNLGVDGVLSRRLGQVHRRHGSPHRGSVIVSVASLTGLVVLATLQLDGDTAYARIAGVYAYCFVILLAIAALAIAIFLFRDRSAKKATVQAVCTSIAFVFFAIALVLCTLNFDLLAGTTGVATVAMVSIIWGLVAAGVVLALIYRSRRPDVYAHIGREDAADALNEPGPLQPTTAN